MAAVTWPAPAAAPEPEPVQPGPADIRAAYERDIQQLDADATMHPAAKAVLYARAFAKADSALRALEAEADRADTIAFAGQHAEELFDAEASSDGGGQRDILAARDAVDRAASATTPEDAQARLAQAGKRRDVPLWNALAAEVCRRAASDPSYAPLAERVIESSPAKQRIAKMRAHGSAAAIAESRGRFWLSPPRQLGELDRHQVHTLAQRDPAEAVKRANARDAGAWDRMRKFKPMSV